MNCLNQKLSTEADNFPLTGEVDIRMPNLNFSPKLSLPSGIIIPEVRADFLGWLFTLACTAYSQVDHTRCDPLPRPRLSVSYLITRQPPCERHAELRVIAIAWTLKGSLNCSQIITRRTDCILGGKSAVKRAVSTHLVALKEIKGIPIHV